MTARKERPELDHTVPTGPVTITPPPDLTPDVPVPTDVLGSDPTPLTLDPAGQQLTSGEPLTGAVDVALDGQPARVAQSVPASAGFGLTREDGTPINLEDVLGTATVTTVRITEPVYEKVILAGSDPAHPRVGRVLRFRKGRSVPVSELRRVQARVALVEAKEAQGRAPENKGPTALETK